MNVPCTLPWEALEVHDNGEVKVCCWTNYVVGSVQEQALGDIWNGPALRHMRQRMLRQDLEGMCPRWCPWLADKRHRELDLNITSATLLHRNNRVLIADAIAAGRTTMDTHPVRMRVLPTMQCNIACVMCYQDHSAGQFHWPVTDHDLDEFLPYLTTLSFIGGEPLMSRSFRMFVQRFDASKYPDCRLMMITNGLLLNRRFLDLMPGRFCWLGISVDGASKTVYERIRAGASWQKLMSNLEAVASHPMRDFPVSLVFTIMRDNLHELRAMRELASSRGFRLSVHPVGGDWHGQDITDVHQIDAILKELEAWSRHDDAIAVDNLVGTVVHYRHLKAHITGKAYN